MHAPSTLSASASLKARVRAESAYADLRLIVNVLSWVLVGIIGIIIVLQAVMFSSIGVGGVALLWGVLQVFGVLLLRVIVHVLIDIPDIALFCASQADHAVTPQADDSCEGSDSL
jgi:uncharacterized membrane protein